MDCAVCGAPPLPRDGVCVFCRAPLDAEAAPDRLLAYVAARLPAARTQRGLFGRGPVRRLQVRAGSEVFEARLKGQGRLQLRPAVDPVEWAERLVTALSREAAGNLGLRQAVSRSGWALRS